MNKLYQIKDDLDIFQKKFRFDKNLASSKPQSAYIYTARSYRTILLLVTYLNVIFDNCSASTNQICLRLAVISLPNCFGAQEHEGQQWRKFSHYWPSLLLLGMQ